MRPLAVTHQGIRAAGRFRQLYGAATIFAATVLLPLNALAFHPDQAKQTSTKVITARIADINVATPNTVVLADITDNTAVSTRLVAAVAMTNKFNTVPTAPSQKGGVANVAAELATGVVSSANNGTTGEFVRSSKGGVVATATELASTVVESIIGLQKDNLASINTSIGLGVAAG
jgi:hypothetical protein